MRENLEQPNPQKQAAQDSRHYVHHANGLLLTTAKLAWHMTKFLAKVAVRIPGWFVRANRANRQAATGSKRSERPASQTTNNSL